MKKVILATALILLAATICFSGSCLTNRDCVGCIDSDKFIAVLQATGSGDQRQSTAMIVEAVRNGDAIRLFKDTEVTLVKRINEVGSIVDIGKIRMMILTESLECE